MCMQPLPPFGTLLAVLTTFSCVGLQMVFNYHGHTSSSISTAYQTEWLMQAVLPSHPNLNRFLGEFVSDVPDDMFAALSPLQQELGAWAWTAVAGVAVCAHCLCPWLPAVTDPLCVCPLCVCACVRCRVVGAGTTVNSLTGASRRSKAQFMLMDYFPGTLQAFIAAWHGRCTPVPYKQAVAILAGVRVCVCSPCDGGPLLHQCLV